MTIDGVVIETNSVSEATQLLQALKGQKQEVHKVKKSRKAVSSFKRWTNDELIKMKELHANGVSPKAIGQILNRSANAISNQLWLMKKQ